mmetsp:Transcript_33094/g.86951  ORF Transcript_33094/g.86951 Transcript_33094/m.86951 type:complete len:109 (+) Transcript_33094:1065-1391(+)
MQRLRLLLANRRSYARYAALRDARSVGIAARIPVSLSIARVWPPALFDVGASMSCVCITAAAASRTGDSLDLALERARCSSQATRNERLLYMSLPSMKHCSTIRSPAT